MKVDNDKIQKSVRNKMGVGLSKYDFLSPSITFIFINDNDFW